MPWAPLLSENFIRGYKVKEFCSIYGPLVPPVFQNPILGNSRVPVVPPTVENQNTGERDVNLHYNTALFEVFKDRGKSRKFASSRVIRHKITQGTLPPIPLFKVDVQATVCAFLSCKGIVQQCKRKPDHVNSNKLTDLCSWCASKYPFSNN